MASAKPKVELRSLTGQGYSRAGVRWSPEWTEVDESKFTKQQLQQLSEDPHLDIRVDGRRLRGKKDAAPAAKDNGAEASLAELRHRLELLLEENVFLSDQLDESKRKNLALAEKVASLEAAAKAGPPPAQPSAPTEPQPPTTSSTANDSGKGSKKT